LSGQTFLDEPNYHNYHKQPRRGLQSVFLIRVCPPFPAKFRWGIANRPPRRRCAAGHPAPPSCPRSLPAPARLQPQPPRLAAPLHHPACQSNGPPRAGGGWYVAVVALRLKAWRQARRAASRVVPRGNGVGGRGCWSPGPSAAGAGPGRRAIDTDESAVAPMTSDYSCAHAFVATTVKGHNPCLGTPTR
jgi:hypothetical protein